MHMQMNYVHMQFRRNLVQEIANFMELGSNFRRGQGGANWENKSGMWAGSGRKRSGMRESCEGGRREKNKGHLKTGHIGFYASGLLITNVDHIIQILHF